MTAAGYGTLVVFPLVLAAFVAAALMPRSAYVRGGRGRKAVWVAGLGVVLLLCFLGVDAGRVAGLMSSVLFLGWVLPGSRVGGPASVGRPALLGPRGVLTDLSLLPLSACTAVLPLYPVMVLAAGAMDTEVLREGAEAVGARADQSGLAEVSLTYFATLVLLAVSHALRPLRTDPDGSVPARLVRNLSLPGRVWLGPLRAAIRRTGPLGALLLLTLFTAGLLLNRPELWDALRGDHGRLSAWILVIAVGSMLLLGSTVQALRWGNQYDSGVKVTTELNFWAGLVPIGIGMVVVLVVLGLRWLTALIAAPVLSTWIWATYQFPDALGWFRVLTWPLDGQQPVRPDTTGGGSDYSLVDWAALTSATGFSWALALMFLPPLVLGLAVRQKGM